MKHIDKNFNRRIGHAGVMRVKAELMLKGFDVAEPDVDCGVDLIAWDSKSISRIQVKSTNQKHGNNAARFQTTKLINGNDKSRRSYDPREIDFLVCVSIPLNEFWIIPAKDIQSKIKICMVTGNVYHNKWNYLSKSNRKIDGDQLSERRDLLIQVVNSQKKIENLAKSINKLELIKNIHEHKISNFHRYLSKDGWSTDTIKNIERYSTEYTPDEWKKMCFQDEIRYLDINKHFLESKYKRLNNLK
jgi:PD-(D/E)XK endonuclease